MFSACVQVLEANENDESFLVRWTQNSKTKWVSRVNIYFAPLETAEHATERKTAVAGRESLAYLL